MLSEFTKLADKEPVLEFAQVPFNHPLYIMYSSGTTGPPKCMVHSAGVSTKIANIELLPEKKNIFSPQKGLEFLRNRVGSVRPKNLKKFMKLYKLEFPEWWGSKKKTPFCGEGMDIFWNYKVKLLIHK